MTQEQVNAMLNEFRSLVGRCGHIDAEIRRLEREIEHVREQFARDAAAPRVSRLTGMPGGSGNSPGSAPGNPTERVALMLADGTAFECSDAGAEVRRLEARIEALHAEQAEKALRIQYVNSWLSGLAERERWVIERHIIDREIWHDIIAQFNVRFMDDVSKDRLKRIQQRALARIYEMAS